MIIYIFEVHVFYISKTSVLSLTLKILMMLNILFEISLLYAKLVEKICHMAMIYIVPPSAAVLCISGIVLTILFFILKYIAAPLTKKIFDDIIKKNNFYEIKSLNFQENGIAAIFLTCYEISFKRSLLRILRPVIFILIVYGCVLMLYCCNFSKLLIIIYNKIYFYFYTFTDIKPFDIMYY